jgi:hypothetical protein
MGAVVKPMARVADLALVQPPAGAGRVLLAAAPPDAARAGLALLGPTRATARVAVFGLDLFLRVGGAHLLPHRPVSAAELAPDDLWPAVLDAACSVHGRPDAVAVYRRVQASRPGGAVLLIGPGPQRAFLKVHRDAPALRREEAVLRALSGADLRSCSVARPLASGEVDGWGWMLTSALPRALHQPDFGFDVVLFAAEIARTLRAVLGSPAEPGWVPMHGDLAPWNVRRSRRGSPSFVLDWESAAWAPSGADAVYYRATAAVARHRRPAPGVASAEAVAFWLDLIGRRDPADADADFNRRLASVMASMPAT